MKSLTHQQTRAQGIARIVQSSVRTEDSLTAKLERTRAEVRRAITDVQAVEGRFLDYETADILQRTLSSAARNLQELTLQVAVLERKR
jgi:predicted transcriptional regulator